MAPTPWPRAAWKLWRDAENAKAPSLDLGLGKMFSDPNPITNLKNNPKPRELMKDPNLVAKLLQIQANPQAGMSTMLSDPRMMTIMAALMGIDFDMPTDEKTQESSADSSKPEPKAEPKPETKPGTKGWTKGRG